MAEVDWADVAAVAVLMNEAEVKELAGAAINAGLADSLLELVAAGIRYGAREEKRRRNLRKRSKRRIRGFASIDYPPPRYGDEVYQFGANRVTTDPNLARPPGSCPIGECVGRRDEYFVWVRLRKAPV